MMHKIQEDKKYLHDRFTNDGKPPLLEQSQSAEKATAPIKAR